MCKKQCKLWAGQGLLELMEGKIQGKWLDYSSQGHIILKKVFWPLQLLCSITAYDYSRLIALVVITLY